MTSWTATLRSGALSRKATIYKRVGWRVLLPPDPSLPFPHGRSGCRWLSSQAFAGTSLENALNKVNLYTKGSQGAQLLTWKGVVDPHNFAATIIVYRAEDGKEYPAYCGNPNRRRRSPHGSFGSPRWTPACIPAKDICHPWRQARPQLFSALWKATIYKRVGWRVLLPPDPSLPFCSDRSEEK